VAEIKDLPTWDLSNIFPSLDSEEFSLATKKMGQLTAQLSDYMSENHISASDTPPTDPQLLGDIIGGFIENGNELFVLAYTIRAYIASFVTTDSYNNEAMKSQSAWQQAAIKIEQMENVVFKDWVGKAKDTLPAAIEKNEIAKAHQFYLIETLEQSQYMMSPEQEELAGEMSLTGASAWSKLQGTITSQLKWDIEDENGDVKSTPLTAIINLRSHENEAMRKKGYEAELLAWKSVETQLAACMNGVKGAVNITNRRRGRTDALHSSIDASRIDRETLNAMLSAMKNSFPMFQKYFKSKARKLGKESLPWWDLFAPLGKLDKSFSYPDAQKYILENFGKFSPELEAYAKKAFDNNWIDVGPREGKRAGAFCMGIPAPEESRILLNFDGNIDWVFTLAHELGHGYHNECLKGKTLFQTNTPMPLAETASIMCETIVTNAAIKEASNPMEELAILETTLNSSSQVVVDIYSRYLFEKEVFERREKSELSAEELNEIMSWAQKETYGAGVDENYLQPYMWTWKPHYYRDSLSFYNYPYAFGLLFATGLYAIYQERGDAFVPQYNDLLASTGMDNAADLAARFDIDLRSEAFWQSSLDVIGARVDRYVAIKE
jgi:oligoendopeptidase F